MTTICADCSKNYFRYYHESRTHLSLNKDAPECRAIQSDRIVQIPEVGGLHHRYERRAAKIRKQSGVSIGSDTCFGESLRNTQPKSCLPIGYCASPMFHFGESAQRSDSFVLFITTDELWRMIAAFTLTCSRIGELFGGSFWGDGEISGPVRFRDMPFACEHCCRLLRSASCSYHSRKARQ
jgi:hypothetical protein